MPETREQSIENLERAFKSWEEAAKDPGRYTYPDSIHREGMCWGIVKGLLSAYLRLDVITGAEECEYMERLHERSDPK